MFLSLDPSSDSAESKKDCFCFTKGAATNMAAEGVLEGAGKKKIKWQRQKKGADDSPPASIGSKPASPSSVSLSTTRELPTASSSSSFPGRFLGFLFSPLGVACIFLAVNYPWLKQYYDGRMLSLSNSRALPLQSTIPKVVVVDPAPTVAPTGTSTVSELLSPECQNPLKKLLDRNCRLQLRNLRREKKAEQMRTQREKGERRKKRREPQQQRQKNTAPVVTYANETIATTNATPNEKNIVINEQYFLKNMDCGNILSRECRQKKRLMAQMKAALAK
jgi:hypothetical protein